MLLISAPLAKAGVSRMNDGVGSGPGSGSGVGLLPQERMAAKKAAMKMTFFMAASYLICMNYQSSKTTEELGPRVSSFS